MITKKAGRLQNGLLRINNPALRLRFGVKCYQPYDLHIQLPLAPYYKYLDIFIKNYSFNFNKIINSGIFRLDLQFKLLSTYNNAFCFIKVILAGV